jgi:hypothetical protein
VSDCVCRHELWFPERLGSSVLDVEPIDQLSFLELVSVTVSASQLVFVSGLELVRRTLLTLASPYGLGLLTVITAIRVICNLA